MIAVLRIIPTKNLIIRGQSRNDVALQEVDDRHAVVGRDENAFGHRFRIVAREVRIDFCLQTV